MPKTPDTILALDPGTRELGYAVLQGLRLLDHGVLTLRHVPVRHRLQRVREVADVWLRAHRPDILVLETIPTHSELASAELPALGRLLRRIAHAHDLALAMYSAKAVRRTVLNNGWAGKAEVAETLVGRYPQLRIYRGQTRKWKDRYWQNMFDAIALALHHQAAHPPSRSRFSD